MIDQKRKPPRPRSLLGYDPADWGYTPSQDFRLTMRAIPLLLVLILGFSVGYSHSRASDIGGAASRAMDTYSGDHRRILEHAYSLYVHGDYTAAVQAANGVVETDPENPLAYNILGLVHAKRGLTEEAARNFETAVELDPDFALAWFNLGIVEESRGEYRRAFEAYTQAGELEPGNVRYTDAAKRSEETASGQGKWDWTETANEKLFMEGIAATNSSNPDDYPYAENIFRQLLLERPYDVASRNMLGLTLARQGKLTEAENYLVQVVEIEPGYSDAWFNLGMVHRATGRYQEALTDFETARESSSIDSFRESASKAADEVRDLIQSTQ